LIPWRFYGIKLRFKVNFTGKIFVRKNRRAKVKTWMRNRYFFEREFLAIHE